MLKKLNFKAVYNSEEDNILEDFYIPALSNSVSYDRAVGYFDAKMLTSAASGLGAFIANNGKSAGQTVFHLHFHVLGGRSYAESAL